MKTDRVCTAGSAKWEEHIEYDDEGNMVLKDGNEFGVYGLGFDEYNKSIFNEKGICIYNEFTDFDDFLPKANYGKPVVTVEYDPETNTVIGYDVRNRYGRTIICYIRDKRYEAQLTPDGNYDRVTYYYDDYYKDSSGDYHDARKIKQYEYDADKNCSGSTAITYDEDENMMKKDVFDPEDRNIFHAEYTDGAETLREETTYDPEGNETLYVKYEEGLETLRRETTYDPEGREILYVEYTEGLETLSRETDHNASDPDYPGENVRIVRTYQPDTDGEMILQEEERSKKFVMGGYWNFYNEKEADYHPYYSEIRIGDKMRVSLNSSFYDNGMINTRKFYEYDGYGIVEEEEIRKYDRHGNLIRESSFNDHGKLVPISEWKYTYRD
ncbi:MAG: hypothetical protein J5825_10460 [Lachnospiraceae bacterium]|nr:hypothetical protein [Lachnospiraceae bacterium]